MKKLLGWQLGAILGIGWALVEGLTVYLRALVVPQGGMGPGFLLFPTIWVHQGGAISVDWLSGVFGFVFVVVYFMSRATWDTASKGYLTTDLVGSSVVTTTLYTAVVIGLAQLYSEANLVWTTNWLGALAMVLLAWLQIEAILLMATAVVVGGHGLQTHALDHSLAVAPAWTLLFILPFVGFLGVQQLQVLIPGGQYQFGPAYAGPAHSGWLVGFALVMIIGLAAAFIWRFAQDLDRK